MSWMSWACFQVSMVSLVAYSFLGGFPWDVFGTCFWVFVGWGLDLLRMSLGVFALSDCCCNIASDAALIVQFSFRSKAATNPVRNGNAKSKRSVQAAHASQLAARQAVAKKALQRKNQDCAPCSISLVCRLRR